jgi:hypothetical protein
MLSTAKRACWPSLVILAYLTAHRLGLYGLGNLRDERLCRLFQTPGCVEWYALPGTSPCHPCQPASVSAPLALLIACHSFHLVSRNHTCTHACLPACLQGAPRRHRGGSQG